MDLSAETEQTDRGGYLILLLLCSKTPPVYLPFFSFITSAPLHFSLNKPERNIATGCIPQYIPDMTGSLTGSIMINIRCSGNTKRT